MKTISEVALSYVGQTEKPKNSGFKDEVFENKMEDVGFSSGQAWCSYFDELCARESNPNKDSEYAALFHASATKTWNNFKKAGYATSDKFIQGANQICIWQLYVDGVAQWQGHAGVPVSGDDNHFISVEGNTDDGKGINREGYIVSKKEHSYRYEAPTKGRALVLLGFINLDSK